ncbi:hypothetical protein [Streptomyces kunmingensis]
MNSTTGYATVLLDDRFRWEPLLWLVRHSRSVTVPLARSALDAYEIDTPARINPMTRNSDPNAITPKVIHHAEPRPRT